MARKLEVEIVGDSRSFERSLSTASRATSGFGSTLTSVGKVAALAAGAAGIGALAVTLKSGISEWQDSAKVAAQTGAVLKSTGGAANVTAKDVDTLATALMNKSGIDDEAIKSGENMLLTFTGIRNEVGKGNDIFNQATKAVVDMDVAMTHGNSTQESLSKTSILVGKALNDPIRGMTALRRVGVSFTEGQQKQIKALVESGHTMEAQKLIVRELTKEFGGSAKALGDTLPGQLNKAKEAFKNMAGELVGRLAPAFTRGLQAINSFISRVSAAKGFTAKITVAAQIIWSGLTEAAADLRNKLSDILFGGAQPAAFGGEHAVTIDPGLVAKIRDAFEKLDWSSVGSSIIDGIVSALRTAGELAKQLATTVTNAIGQVDWIAVGRTVGPGLAAAITVAFTTLLDPGFWVRNWDLALAVALTAFGGAIGRLGGRLGVLLAKPFGDAILVTAGVIGRLSPALANAFLVGLTRLPGLILATLRPIGGLISAALRPLEGLVAAIFGRLARLAVFTIKVLGIQAAINAALQAGQDIVAGIRRGLSAVGGAVKGALDAIWRVITTVAKLAYNAAKAIGAEIIHGVVDGVKGLVGQVTGAIDKYITGPIGRALHSIPGFSPPVDVGRWLGKELVRGIVEAVRAGQPAVADAVTGLTGSMAKRIGSAAPAIIAAARKVGVDARAALAVAMAEGGTKFGAVGDKGTSFGPFQLHLGGALPAGMDPAKAAAFANSIRGITFALQEMAKAGAAGKTGYDAITAIVRNFEKPADPSGEIRRAITYYKQLPAEVASATVSVAQKTGAVVSSTLKGTYTLIQTLGKDIGIAHAKAIVASIVEGMNQGQPTVMQQIRAQALERMAAMKQAVVERRADFVSAFNDMANAALSAFDARMAAWKPPSLRLLEKMQLQDQIKQLTETMGPAVQSAETALVQALASGNVAGIRAAQVQLNAALLAQYQQVATQQATLVSTAQANLAAAQAEGDPEKIAAAQAALDQALADQTAALAKQQADARALVEQNLQFRADAEQRTHDAIAAKQREGLAKQLAELRTELLKHPQEWDKMGVEVQKILTQYHIKLVGAGKTWATKFGDGITAGTATAVAAARALAAAVAAVLPSTGSPLKPAARGPLAFHPYKMGEQWARNFGAGLAGGGLSGMTTAMVTPPGGGVALAGGGGSVVVNVTVQGALLGSSVPEVAETIRRELIRTAARNGGSAI